MRRITLAVMCGLLVGCMERPAPPPRVWVPPADHGMGPPLRAVDPSKPMPTQVDEASLPPPPFDDAPLVNQAAPEQSAFVDTYNRVGRPRIAIAVERMPSLDDAAIRSVLADWMSCGGQVTLVSSPRQETHPDSSNADVIIQLQAHPTQEYRDGQRMRLVAEAMNTKDHISIGRAFVDVPSPLEKQQINRYTRWLARKLMDDITAAWLQPDPAPVRESSVRPSTAPSDNGAPRSER